MKLQTISTKRGYLAVSDTAAKLPSKFPTIVVELLTTGEWEPWQIDDPNDWDEKTQKDILATDTTFKLEGIPQFLVENKDPFLGYDENSVQKLVKQELIDEHEQRIAYHWFWVGLKAVQQKSCYTEEDLRNALKAGVTIGIDSITAATTYRTRVEYWLEKEDIYIKSLKQPKKLVAIEVETDKVVDNIDNIKFPNLKAGEEILRIIVSEQYPDGLLTVKKYYYE